MRKCLYCVAVSLVSIAGASDVQAAAPSLPEKVIIDSDFGDFTDDGQAFILAADAQAEQKIQILGMTLVAGNSWVEEEEPSALKAVERAGLEERVPVFAGAAEPLLHSFKSFEQERALFGVGDGYWGAFSHPRPIAAANVAPPVDGFAAHTHLRRESAVDFIIDTIRKNPHEITILALGPLTNLALAFREAPDIIPLIKRIVYMGGAFDVPGNTVPAAEFNIWFDPEAAKIVWREPIQHIIVPLDVTDKVRLTSDVYKEIADANPVVARLIRSRGTDLLDGTTKPVWFYDQLAMAYIADPSLATEIEERWVDVDANYGIDYGKTVSYREVRPENAWLVKAKIIKNFDTTRFRDYFIKALIRSFPAVKAANAEKR